MKTSYMYDGCLIAIFERNGSFEWSVRRNNDLKSFGQSSNADEASQEAERFVNGFWSERGC